MAYPTFPIPREFEELLRLALSRNYISTILDASDPKKSSITFTDRSVLGQPANLFVAAAGEESILNINNGPDIPMKRDEAIVIINALEIESVTVKSGRVKIFATVVPKWMPALFWTRSVTVLGVADAVYDALVKYKAATETTLSGIKTQTDKLRFDTDSDLIVTTRAKEGTPIDYTTTDTLSDVAVLGISMFDEVTIFIKNTGTTNSADVAVYTKVNANGQIEYEEVPLTTLAPGDVLKVQLSGRYARVIIRAKSTTAGASTTLRIEWIGGK